MSDRGRIGLVQPFDLQRLPRPFWLALVWLCLSLSLSLPASAQTVGPPQAVLCNKIAISGVLSAGTTQLVAAVANQGINTCGWYIEGLGNGTVQLVFGTGTSCTSPTSITSNITTTVSSFVSDHIPYAFITTPSGQSVCAVVTGASAAAIAFYYSQF